MKNVCLPIILCLACFCAASNLTSAQTTTATSTEILAATTTSSTPQTREVPTTITRAPTPLLNQPLPDTKQKRIINLAANISNRIDAMISRLTTIASRLESRLDKTAAAGHDVTAATSALKQAQTHINTAAKNMSNIDARVYASITSESPQKTWPKVKSTYLTTKSELLLAKESLFICLTALKNPPRVAPQTEITAENTEI